ncbi:uncharacterized protein DS421_17g593860 [Arachis hypogaea]|nr:uncharacterized protein DS421_17g593860 [Arachis hypogaea]
MWAWGEANSANLNDKGQPRPIILGVASTMRFRMAVISLGGQTQKLEERSRILKLQETGRKLQL